jgi:isoamylase
MAIDPSSWLLIIKKIVTLLVFNYLNITTYPGSPYPLGATANDEGVNFALYADNATGVELCLFNSPDDPQAAATIKIIERTHQIWHVFLPGIKPGQLYGYRVYGTL